jgi:hypothetical protein
VAPSYLPNDYARVLEQGASLKVQVGPQDYLYFTLTRGVCHTGALPFTLKNSILRQKKNYGNSNIFPCKNTPNLQNTSSKRNQNPSRYYSSVTNLKFEHKPKYHLSKILR